MKVLAIAKTFEKGGAATGAFNTVQSLRAAGLAVTTLDGFAARRGRPVAALRLAERLYERAVHGPDTHCLRLGPPVFDLATEYAREKPDIIQLFDVSGNTIAFGPLAHLPCPVVHRLSDFWPYHGPRHYATAPASRRGAADLMLTKTIFDGSASPTALVAPSRWLADRLQGHRPRFIRNAVSAVPDMHPRRALGPAVRFGFIANPVTDPRKGLSAVFPVLKALAAQTGPVQLHLFGEGSGGVRGTIPGVEVISHPAFSRSQLSKVYGAFDVLLCPSKRDNSPNVLTEALSHAVPVVAQSGTGMDSYLAQPFGLLLDFEADPAASATLIGGVLANYAQASREALSWSVEELAPVKIGQQYAALYSELLAQNGTSPKAEGDGTIAPRPRDDQRTGR